jgi:hypothetical protein
MNKCRLLLHFSVLLEVIRYLFGSYGKREKKNEGEALLPIR